MFIQQALKGKNDWGRTLIVCLPFIVIFGLGFLIFFALSPEEYDRMLRHSSQRFESKNVRLVLMLSQFGFLLVMLLALFYLLHRSSIVSLTTARSKSAFKSIFCASFIVLIFQGGLFAVS